MKNFFLFFAVFFYLFVALVAAPYYCLAMPATPDIVGFGAETIHASGRGAGQALTVKVYRITNLNDSGSHSLRECKDGTGPRVCVFEVSGNIILQSAIIFKNPYVWIACQTAPNPGIHFQGYRIGFQDTHDILVEHCDSRPGDANPSNSLDAWNVRNSYNIVFSHIEGWWAGDEALEIGSTVADPDHNITIQNSIFAETLYHGVHPEGAHSMGPMIGHPSGALQSELTVVNNIFAHNRERNWRVRTSLGAGTSLEFINNTLYNPGVGADKNFYVLREVAGSGLTCDPTNNNCIIKLNFIGNYYQLGQNSSAADYIIGQQSARGIGSGSRFYVHGNLHRNLAGSLGRRIEQTDPEWSGVTNFPTSPYQSATVISGSSSGTINPIEAGLARARNLVFAGARPKNRNASVTRLVAEMEDLTPDPWNTYKDCVAGASHTCARGVAAETTTPSYAVVTRTVVLPKNPVHGVATVFDSEADFQGNVRNELENAIYEDYTLPVEEDPAVPQPTPTPTPTPTSTPTPNPGITPTAVPTATAGGTPEPHVIHFFTGSRPLPAQLGGQ